MVDDEKEILDLLMKVLKEEGYEVFPAHDGVEGMEQFQRLQPDLVITDVRMPQMNGLELLKEIRKMETGVDVIILTGFSDEATAIDCLRAGAHDYLLKPLMPETGEAEGIDMVNRIMAGVRKHSFKQGDREIYLTLSVGCAIFPECSKDNRELMEQAERALSRAKSGGRDRVELGPTVNDEGPLN